MLETDRPCVSGTPLTARRVPAQAFLSSFPLHKRKRSLLDLPKSKGGQEPRSCSRARAEQMERGGQALNRRGVTHPEGRDGFHGNAAGAAGRRPKLGETGLALVGERGQSAFLPCQCVEYCYHLRRGHLSKGGVAGGLRCRPKADCVKQTEHGSYRALLRQSTLQIGEKLCPVKWRKLLP